MKRRWIVELEIETDWDVEEGELHAALLIPPQTMDFDTHVVQINLIKEKTQ